MEFLKKLGWRKLSIIGVSTFAILISLGVLIFNLTAVSMVPLFSHLSKEDSNIIALKLGALGVPVDFTQDNSEILVPADKVLSLRMYLAQEGLPASGSVIGYEIFDKESALGTSQFVNNVNLTRALEGELARTISSIAQIESARVHLVLPRKELFSRVNNEPSASIVVKVKNGKTISKSEIVAITNLVSSAVSELNPEKVTIVDTKGNPLKILTPEGGSSYSDSLETSNIIDYQFTVENKLKLMLEELLSKYVGNGKVKANVSVEIDLDREVINSEIYDPNGQVVRSHKASEEKESDMPRSDNISVANNLPNINQKVDEDKNVKTKSKSDEITNYEISKTVTNKIIERGGLKNISVAILVDGKYSYDEKLDKLVYTPRTQEELDQIKLLVSSAVGLDTKRGDKLEVVNLKFAVSNDDNEEDSKATNWLKENLEKIVQTIVIGLVAILAILLIFRPIIMKMINNHKAKEMKGLEGGNTNFSNNSDLNEELMEKQNNLGGLDMEMDRDDNFIDREEDSGGDFESGAKRYSNMIKYLNELVSKYPNEAASVIKGWVYKDNEE